MSLMSINHVPPPPHPFRAELHTIVLPIDTILHRLYSKKHAGNTFNSSHEKLNRFSPIFYEGKVVPVLYAGSSLQCAIYETLFHDAYLAKRRALPVTSIEDRRYGGWIVQRALTVATLHAPDLARFELTIDQLTATNAMYYPQTARWAEAIHNNHPDVQGLEWTSYRAGPERAYVLFGDRVKPHDLRTAGNQVDVATDHLVYKEVIECGHRVGVRVHDSRL